MSEKVWSRCLAELRDKAVHFSKTKHVRVLDTGSCVCKSGTPDLKSLAASIRSVATPLLEQHRSNEDWWPTSDDPVFNIVDPLLFPLVYGESLVLAEGRQVNLRNIFGSYEDATVAPKHFDRRIDSQTVKQQVEEGRFLCMGLHPNQSESNLSVELKLSTAPMRRGISQG